MSKEWWDFRGAASASYGSLPQVCFDPKLELLWTGDQYGYVTSFGYQTPVSQEVAWTTYSAFRGFKDQIVALVPFYHEVKEQSFVASACSSGSIRVNKVGGFGVLKQEVGPSSTTATPLKRIQQMAMTVDGDNNPQLFVSGDSLLQLNLADFKTTSTPVTVLSDTPLITSLRGSGTTLLCGFGSGEVHVFSTANNGFEKIATLKGSGKVQSMDLRGYIVFCSCFSDRQNSAVRVYDLSSVQNTSTCKKMDNKVEAVDDQREGGGDGSAEKIDAKENEREGCTPPTQEEPADSTPTLDPIHSMLVSGTVVSLQCYETSEASVVDGVEDAAATRSAATAASGTAAFLLTSSQGIHVVSAMSQKAHYTRCDFTGGSFTCATVSKSGKCAIIGNDLGQVFGFSSRGSPQDSFTFAADDKLVVPPQPKVSRGWERPKDIGPAIDFDHNHPYEDLASSWPPDHYMCGNMDMHHRQLPPSLLTRIRPKQVMVNYIGLTRADVYAPDPKDPMAAILPNPYPFNDKVGNDPAEAAHLLRELHKELKKNAKRIHTTGSYYSKPEEAQQVVYGSNYEWSSVNSSNDVIGLDNSYPESWVNSILQCLYHVYAPYYPVRKALMHHICKKRFCITCEISILFTNMQIQSMHLAKQCKISQPHNVFRTMLMNPTLKEAGVFTATSSRDESVANFHTLHSLLLQIINDDVRTQTQFRFPLPTGVVPQDYANIITTLFGTELQLTKSTIAPQLHWDVPASATKVDEGLQHLLKKLEMHNDERATIKNLPPILVLLLNPEHGTLQPPSNLKFSRLKEEFNYLLNSSVIHLAYDKDDPGHFVNHIRTTADGFFFILNDYLVSNPGKEEELQSHIPAMTPHATVCAYYALQDYKVPKYGTRSFEDRLPMHEICPNLVRDDFFSTIVNQSQTIEREVELEYVDPKDIFTGNIVALDAEYVVLKWGNNSFEDKMMRSERSPVMTLARLSCILSKGEDDERTIVDDYVATPEAVQDYVTQYSGISEGDLDIAKSKRPLTALKATYLKLRMLMDKGVRFLGHGLAQDFRVLNIAVPPHQIIDTVELYRQPGGRKMRLRFLAYHVLGERVQEAEHDSVEDARTALRLYRKYEQLRKDNIFEETLDNLYFKGSSTNWQIPGDNPFPGRQSAKPRDASSGTSPTPATPPVEEEVAAATPPAETVAAA